MNRCATRSAKNSTSHLLDQRLRMYSLAASAASMSVAALTCPANAEIVFTPAQAKLTHTSQFPIDFNHDGVIDFLIINQSLYKTGISCSFCGQNLNVRGNGNLGEEVVGKKFRLSGEAAALPAGAIVGSPDQFVNARGADVLMASGFNSDNSFFNIYGEFSNTRNRFLGVKFEINGEVHYGWIRFAVVTVGIRGSVPFLTAVVNGYAYETVPNHPIVAGARSGSDTIGKNQTGSRSLAAPTRAATLGLLAMGSPALSVWRREESVAGVRP